MRILVLGLDNAGKTTILYRLHLGEVIICQKSRGCEYHESGIPNTKRHHLQSARVIPEMMMLYEQGTRSKMQQVHSSGEVSNISDSIVS